MIARDKGGNLICKHGRRKATCVLCDGSQVCIHNRQRRQCKECGEHYAFKKGGFAKEEIQQIGAVEQCQFPGCLVRAENLKIGLHSDHDHACCPYKKVCTECYRGELCRAHNTWMAVFDAHPEWAIAADIREYLSRRPYARVPKFLLISKYITGENHDRSYRIHY